jgi:hypothetical protein
VRHKYAMKGLNNPTYPKANGRLATERCMRSGDELGEAGYRRLSPTAKNRIRAGRPLTFVVTLEPRVLWPGSEPR